MQTVAEKIQQIVDDRNPNFDRILILRIVSFPENSEIQEDRREKGNHSRGWMHATLGPINTVMKTVFSAQQIRGELEFELIKILYEREGLLIDDIEIRPPPEIYGSFKPPLSWRLSDKEKNKVGKAWSNLLENNSGPVGRVIDFFKDQIKRQWLPESLEYGPQLCGC